MGEGTSGAYPLVLPMGVGIDHAGVHVGGLSLDVVARYAADERLPAEQRAAIRLWLESQGMKAEAIDEAVAVAVDTDDGPDDSDFA